jgi:hypothetical protein
MPICIIISDDQIPERQARINSVPPTADRVGDPDQWKCQKCWWSLPALGSLGGVWLFCDHPESFKRYVRPDSACECWQLEAPATPIHASPEKMEKPS